MSEQNSKKWAEENEQQLIQRAQQGDQRAFSALDRHYRPMIAGLIRDKICNLSSESTDFAGIQGIERGDDTKDLIQEVFINAFRQIGAFRGESKLGTYLFRAALNKCKDYYRAQDRRDKWIFGAYKEETTQPRKEAYIKSPDYPDAKRQGRNRTEVIREALKKLKPKHRNALILKHCFGFSEERLAEISGTFSPLCCSYNITPLPLGTIKSRLNTARKKAEKILQPDFSE